MKDTYPLVLALYDFVPVAFFLIGAIFLVRISIRMCGIRCGRLAIAGSLLIDVKSWDSPTNCFKTFGSLQNQHNPGHIWTFITWDATRNCRFYRRFSHSIRVEIAHEMLKMRKP